MAGRPGRIRLGPPVRRRAGVATDRRDRRRHGVCADRGQRPGSHRRSARPRSDRHGSARRGERGEHDRRLRRFRARLDHCPQHLGTRPRRGARRQRCGGTAERDVRSARRRRPARVSRSASICVGALWCRSTARTMPRRCSDLPRRGVSVSRLARGSWPSSRPSAIARAAFSTATYPASVARRLARRSHHPVDFEVLHDEHPGRAIGRFAGDIGASLIVASTHGRAGLARFAIGSRAMSIVRHAPCPVVLSRPPHLRR